MKTATEIELYIKSLIEKSPLKKLIKGGIYTDGLRPLDSKKEDIVISFAAGLDGQISTGVVMVNTYIPNVDYGANRIGKDSARCAIIERAILDFRETLPVNEFLFSPGSTVQSNPVPEVQQYYVNLKLNYKLWQD